MRKQVDSPRNKDKRINARITAAQFDELQKISLKKDLPVSHLVRIAIKNFLLDK